MEKKISVIIVTYNSQLHITECIDSIGTHLDIDPHQIEIIVVDNSAGKNADELKHLSENHPLNAKLSILYIRNPTNMGYGQGNNVGIKASTGDIVCIMNPDVRFNSPILNDVLEKFRNRKLALLGYKEIGGCDLSYYIKPEFKNIFAGSITKVANRFNVFLQKYFYLSGSFFFIDRVKMQEIGYFDENIFLYFEEPDIANRMSSKNYEIWYDKSKRYLHLVDNRAEWSETSFSHEIKSLKYYFDKFNFDAQKSIRNYLYEYWIKIWVAKILNDQKKLDKYSNEVKLIKEVFASTEKP